MKMLRSKTSKTPLAKVIDYLIGGIAHSVGPN